jgi:hypothetical protein
MHQQEMFSEEQDQQPLESEIQAQSYYWSTRPKARTGDAPKNEHPSTYEESIPPYSYRAQESVSDPLDQEASVNRANARVHRAESARDAFGQSYRPYTAYTMQWQVPPWARPQYNNGNGLRTAVFVVLGLLLFAPLLKLLFFLVAGIGILLGITVLAIAFIPIIIAFLAMLAVIALMVLGLFGIRPWRFRRRTFRHWGRGFQGW